MEQSEMEYSDYLVLSPMVEDPSVQEHHQEQHHQPNQSSNESVMNMLSSPNGLDVVDKDGFAVPFRKISKRKAPQLRVDTSNLNEAKSLKLMLKSPSSRLGSPLTPTASTAAVGVFIDSPRLRFGYGDYHILSPRTSHNSSSTTIIGKSPSILKNSLVFSFPSQSNGSHLACSSPPKTIIQRDFVPMKRKITLGKWRKSVLKCLTSSGGKMITGGRRSRSGSSGSRGNAGSGSLSGDHHEKSDIQQNEILSSIAVNEMDSVESSLGQCSNLAAPLFMSDPLSKVDFNQLSLSQATSNNQPSALLQLPPIIDNIMVQEQELPFESIPEAPEDDSSHPFAMDTDWMQMFDGTSNIYLPQMISPNFDTSAAAAATNNFDLITTDPFPHPSPTVMQQLLSVFAAPSPQQPNPPVLSQHQQSSSLQQNQFVNFGQFPQQQLQQMYQHQQYMIPQLQPAPAPQDRQKRSYQRHPTPQPPSSAQTTLIDENGEKKFRCPFQECQHEFIRRHDLLRHIRIHTEDKPFRCDRCMKAFTRQDALKRHVQISEKYGGQCRVTRGRVPKSVAQSAGQR